MILTKRAKENSTYAVVVQFLDENGDSVTPTAAPEWTLSRCDGTEIDTGTVTAAETMNIILSGTQLAVSDTEARQYREEAGCKTAYVTRRLSVSGVVTTDLGSDLPVTNEFLFVIDNLAAI